MRLPDAERARYDTGGANAARRARRSTKQRDYAAVTRLIVEVADEANGYVAEKAPWLLAKDEARRGELHVVCTLAVNYFRLLSTYLAPIVPKMAGLVADNFLGTARTRFHARRYAAARPHDPAVHDA